MPRNSKIARENFLRYVHARDNGHLDYVEKANKCDRFYQAEQWDDAVKQRLRAQGKPVLTINKTLATITAVQGELLMNRQETAFKPGADGNDETAFALSRIFLHIAQRNKLFYLEQDVADDGFITSRGFYDVRMDFDKNFFGDVAITQLNPRDVAIDPHATTYDPDGWREVFVTRWMSPQEIALQYNRTDARELMDMNFSDFMFGYDSVNTPAQSFGGDEYRTPNATGGEADPWLRRHIRVVERQYWKLRRRDFFVDPETGDVSPVPEAWSEERARELAEQQGLLIRPRRYKQIRWTVTADQFVLHDDWSPYEHLTVVPFFPYFRRGKTIGLVENLISPQEQLNKVSSQELHIVNSTANSGWKVKQGTLTNMTEKELEERGAETGLVLVWSGEANEEPEKIQPNQIPQGIDRLTVKADQWMRDVSGINESMRGFDRSDVSGRAIEQKQARGSVNLSKVFDNLARTRHMLAERVLELVQTFKTEPQLLAITGDRPEDPVDQIAVNQPDPVTGRIVNDLSVGKYQVVVSTRPPHQVMQDYQFDEAMRMRTEAGVHVPDRTLIKYSNLEDKQEILDELGGDADAEEQQRQQMEQQMQMQQLQADLAKSQAEAMLSQARAQKVMAEIRGEVPDEKSQTEALQRERERELKQLELASQRELEEMRLAFERERFEREHELKEAEVAEKLEIQRMQVRAQMRQAQQQSGS